ncbi:MAG: BrnT family toxin [Actinobacteria bacterium]|nr:BrnT family toxin [Actinomycetota bacterium]
MNQQIKRDANHFISYKDIKHSQKEARYYALGKTDEDRFLYIVFTVRKKQIRIISARDMNKKERQVYINYEKDS